MAKMNKKSREAYLKKVGMSWPVKKGERLLVEFEIVAEPDDKGRLDLLADTDLMSLLYGSDKDQNIVVGVRATSIYMNNADSQGFAAFRERLKSSINDWIDEMFDPQRHSNMESKLGNLKEFFRYR